MVTLLLEQFLLSLLPYCALGLLVMVEGPAATLMGGAAASSGLLMPVPAYLSIVAGNLTADMGWYSLGRFRTLDWFRNIGSRLGVDTRRVEQLESNIYTHAPRLLFLAKLTVGFPIPALVATGMCRVPVRRWIGMLVLGELMKSAALVGAGYLYARALKQASSGVQTVLGGVTVVLIIAGVIWYKQHSRK